MTLIFETTTPNTEDAILLITDDDVIVQGHYCFSEDDFYTHDGELIHNAKGWCEIPEVYLK